MEQIPPVPSPQMEWKLGHWQLYDAANWVLNWSLELPWAEGNSYGTSFGTLLVLVYSHSTNAPLRAGQVEAQQLEEQAHGEPREWAGSSHFEQL